MKKLSWVEFDECVRSIYKQCKTKQFKGVYGFPRGGLCLAVALSHRLNLPLLDKPQNNSLIVDDIYETGYTLDRIKCLKGIETHVWVSRKEPSWWKAYFYYKEKDWIVFPWENINCAVNDRNLYSKSRS
tara:strand:+ start:296 stop:682 length:387 start_codon:yes stop_codon:yes gene_type:complete